MCDPWESKGFKEQLKSIPDEACEHCLPDCSGTQYSTSLSVSPFRRCDYRNLGVSSLCNLNDATLPEPRIWGAQVIREYEEFFDELPVYIKKQVLHSCKFIPLIGLLCFLCSQVQNSRRRYKGTSSVVFSYLNDQDDPEYDAYQKDIAIANFYFDKSTVLQYSRTPRLTWTGFIGQIGGLLGLCLGASIVSFVELAYWFFYKLVLGVTAPSRKKEKGEPNIDASSNVVIHSRYKKYHGQY